MSLNIHYNKKYFGLFFCLFCFLSTDFVATVHAQGSVASTKKSQYADRDIIRKREFTMAGKIHSAGFGLSANFVKINSIFKKTVLEIELMDLKHPKESRQKGLAIGGNSPSRSYVYAKQNNFYNLNVSLGRMRTIAEKGRKSGVAVYLYYAAGLSLGITKPYYLELIYGVDGGTADVRNQPYVEDENANFFLNENIIRGASKFTFGWTEINLKPGAQAKVALHFDWAGHDEFVKAIEVGAMANAYLGNVPILVTVDDNNINRLAFVNLYVRFLLGKRW